MDPFVDQLRELQRTISFWRNIFVIIWAINWFGCAGLAAFVAKAKNRSTANWFLLGLLLGFAALVAAVGVPTVQAASPKPSAPIGLGRPPADEEDEITRRLKRIG